MAAPWEKYQQAAPAAQGPWNRYQGSEGPGLEIDIVGGTPVPAAVYANGTYDAEPNGGLGVEAAEGYASANPSLFRMDSDFREQAGIGRGAMFVAALKDMFGSRQGAAKYLARKANSEHGLSSLVTGGAQVVGSESDPMIRLENGETYRLNDPGLDTTDIANFAGNVAAFWTPASWAAKLGQAKNFGLARRALTQSGAAGATDLGLQLVANEGDVDPFRTASAAAGGFGGEILGTGVGAAAQRVSRGVRNLRETEPVKSFAVGGNRNTLQEVDEIAAGANPAAIMGRDKYGLQYTQGQRTLKPADQIPLLNREEVLRQTPGAQEMFDAAARRNQEQLATAVGDIGERLGGTHGATPAELAEGAATRVREQAGALKDQIGEAYDAAAKGNRAAVGIDYVSTLPDRLKKAVADFAPNPDTTPVAHRTLQQVKNVTGSFADAGAGGVKGITLKAIDTQRRIINNNINAATNESDRAATIAIKREFDQWVDDAVDNALISGDPGALAALKDARRLRAEYGRRFEGGDDTDRFIAGMLDGSRTPEELINTALGASSVSKAGGARFIERLKEAADGDEEVIGALRSAHFLRMALGKDGAPQNMGDIIRNIRSTKYGNESVVKALYSPEEWAEIESLATALEPLVPKGNYAKSSGTTERLFRMMMQRVGGIPLVGPAAQSVDSMIAGVRANKALNKPLTLKAQAPEGSQATFAATLSEGVR